MEIGYSKAGELNSVDCDSVAFEAKGTTVTPGVKHLDFNGNEGWTLMKNRRCKATIGRMIWISLVNQCVMDSNCPNFL